MFTGAIGGAAGWAGKVGWGGDCMAKMVGDVADVIRWGCWASEAMRWPRGLAMGYDGDGKMGEGAGAGGKCCCCC